jgi:hypothetical protein
MAGWLAVAVLGMSTCVSADTTGAARTTLLSWAGTAELACGAWTRHAVPTHFARSTLAAARHALAQPAAEVRLEASASPDAARTAADLRTLDAALSRMQGLVSRDDRDAMVAEVRQLRAFRLAAR